MRGGGGNLASSPVPGYRLHLIGEVLGRGGAAGDRRGPPRRGRPGRGRPGRADHDHAGHAAAAAGDGAARGAGAAGCSSPLVWCGDLAAGERVLDGFRGPASPITDLVGRRPYPEHVRAPRDAPRRSPTSPTASRPTSWTRRRSGRSWRPSTSPARPRARRSPGGARVLGGAIGRVPVDATAFAHRRRKLPCSLVAAGFAEDDSDRHRGWSLAGALRHLAKGAYLNFLDAADEGRLHETYPDGTYRRLVEVKRRYDRATAAVTSTSAPWRRAPRRSRRNDDERAPDRDLGRRHADHPGRDRRRSAGDPHRRGLQRPVDRGRAGEDPGPLRHRDYLRPARPRRQRRQQQGLRPGP